MPPDVHWLHIPPVARAVARAHPLAQPRAIVGAGHHRADAGSINTGAEPEPDPRSDPQPDPGPVAGAYTHSHRIAYPRPNHVPGTRSDPFPVRAANRFADARAYRGTLRHQV